MTHEAQVRTSQDPALVTLETLTHSPFPALPLPSLLPRVLLCLPPLCVSRPICFSHCGAECVFRGVHPWGVLFFFPPNLSLSLLRSLALVLSQISFPFILSFFRPLFRSLSLQSSIYTIYLSFWQSLLFFIHYLFYNNFQLFMYSTNHYFQQRYNFLLSQSSIPSTLASLSLNNHICLAIALDESPLHAAISHVL